MVRRAFSSVIDGDTMDGVDIQQVIEAFQGVSTVRVPISITQVDSTASYALDVRNTNNNNSLAFRVLDSSGTPRLQIASSDASTLTTQSVKIDPTGAGTLSDITTDLLASTMANKTFSSCTLSTTTKVTLGSDATGDIWYRNSSGEMTRLPIGSSGRFLQSSGGLPVWRDGMTGVSVWLPAGAWEFSTNPFPTYQKFTSTNWIVPVLAFSTVAQGQECYASFGIPTGTPFNSITAYLHWSATAAGGVGSSQVMWSLAHLSRASGEAIDTAAVAIDSTNGILSSANDVVVTSLTLSSITGYAAGEQMFLKLSRASSNSSDTVVIPALLHGVRVEFR